MYNPNNYQIVHFFNLNSKIKVVIEINKKIILVFVSRTINPLCFLFRKKKCVSSYMILFK